MRIGMMCLLCMMHLNVLVCSKSCGQRVNGHDFCPLHSGWWLWTVVFLCLGPVWNHFWNQVSAKLLSSAKTKFTPETSTSKVAEQGRLAKGAKSWVKCHKQSWISEDFPIFFPKTYGSRVPRCLQTRPFHGCQMLAARSSKIHMWTILNLLCLIIFSGASCGICWVFPDFWSMAESSNEIHGSNCRLGFVQAVTLKRKRRSTCWVMLSHADHVVYTWKCCNPSFDFFLRVLAWLDPHFLKE